MDAPIDETMEVLNEVAKKYNVSMAQISLAWLFKKGVTFAIIGTLHKGK